MTVLVLGIFCLLVLLPYPSVSKDPCKSILDKTDGIYLVKLKENVPYSSAFFIARKIVRWNLEDVAKAKQAIFLPPEYGKEFERGIDYQFGCCLFGKLRAITLEKLCSNFPYFLEEVQNVNDMLAAKGVISNIRFAQDLVHDIEEEAIAWRMRKLQKVNDTMVHCKGKISDEMHLYSNDLTSQNFTLILARSDEAALQQFRARMALAVIEGEDFLFNELSYRPFSSRMEITSNRRTITKACEDPSIYIVTPHPRLYLK